MAYRSEEPASAAHKPHAWAGASAAASEAVASLGIHHELAVPLEGANAVLWRLRSYRLQAYAREIMSSQTRGKRSGNRIFPEGLRHVKILADLNEPAGGRLVIV